MSKLPVTKSRQEELELRFKYRGKYIHHFEEEVLDEKTGEYIMVPKQEERFTRFEYPDPMPLELPTGLRPPESTDQKIRRLLAEQRAQDHYLNRPDETEEEFYDNEDDVEHDFAFQRDSYEETDSFVPSKKKKRFFKKPDVKSNDVKENKNKSSDLPSEPVDKKEGE